ncbi:hypothetical protein BDP27DRAFT_1378176 [Rhodocollybia butyracea]|uniref:Uncharacterized protein n=1 Tax=Rhodocollybia butyracea TaxID=206335 RepID=A0A9P5P0T5_9AGAR|nr:hypothetical protein BDP27DRAFT_1378176 [Rhodocollybia butyracea]
MVKVDAGRSYAGFVLARLICFVFALDDVQGFEPITTFTTILSNKWVLEHFTNMLLMLTKVLFLELQLPDLWILPISSVRFDYTFSDPLNTTWDTTCLTPLSAATSPWENVNYKPGYYIGSCLLQLVIIQVGDASFLATSPLDPYHNIHFTFYRRSRLGPNQRRIHEFSVLSSSQTL